MSFDNFIAPKIAQTQLLPRRDPWQADNIRQQFSRFSLGRVCAPHMLHAQVQVVDFKEREGHKDLVQVHVTVETPSQRAIIIGKGGTALKRLGTHSRQDVEAFLGERHV